MVRLSTIADRVLLEEYRQPATSLAVVRIALSCWLLLAGTAEKVMDVRDLPRAFWDPPLGPTRLVQEPPPGWVAPALAASITLGLVMLALGLQSVWAARIAGVGLLASETIQNSFGKVDHGLLLVTLTLILMSWSNWNGALSFDARQGPSPGTGPAWPVATVFLALSVTMAMAALPKIESGWLDPSFSAVRGRLLLGVLGQERTDHLAEPLSTFDVGALWELADIATVCFEAAFILVVWRRRRMQLLVAIAAVFHAAVLLTLNIAFTYQLFVYALAFNWTPVASIRLFRPLEATSGAWRSSFATVVVLSLTAIGLLSTPSRWVIAEVPLAFGGLIGFGYLVRRCHSSMVHMASRPSG